LYYLSCLTVLLRTVLQLWRMWWMNQHWTNGASTWVSHVLIKPQYWPQSNLICVADLTGCSLGSDMGVQHSKRGSWRRMEDPASWSPWFQQKAQIAAVMWTVDLSNCYTSLSVLKLQRCLIFRLSLFLKLSIFS
jgi:hypothetical protein